MEERRFVLRPLADTNDNDSAESLPAGHKKKLQTLNVSVSPGPIAQSTVQQPTAATGLLAIAPPLSSQVLLSSDMYAMGMLSGIGYKVPQTDPSEDLHTSKSASATDVVNGLVQPVENNSENNNASRVVNDKVVVKEKETYCFLCGYHCATGKRYRLSSHSASKSADQLPAAFFPFLAQVQGVKRSRRLSRHGRVDACLYCYHNLLWQWNLYERLSREDRHTRKYHSSAFFCILCRGSITRDCVTHVCVDDIVGRQDILNYGEVVRVGEKGILVCLGCSEKMGRKVKEEVAMETAEDALVSDVFCCH